MLLSLQLLIDDQINLLVWYVSFNKYDVRVYELCFIDGFDFPFKMNPSAQTVPGWLSTQLKDISDNDITNTMQYSWAFSCYLINYILLRYESVSQHYPM